jgi:hypothetical protein
MDMVEELCIVDQCASLWWDLGSWCTPWWPRRSHRMSIYHEWTSRTWPSVRRTRKILHQRRVSVVRFRDCKRKDRQATVGPSFLNEHVQRVRSSSVKCWGLLTFWKANLNLRSTKIVCEHTDQGEGEYRRRLFAVWVADQARSAGSRPSFLLAHSRAST